MTEKNPFTLSFARQPNEYIPRPKQSQIIIDAFTVPPVTEQVYIIKGVRGTGKTVLMNGIASELKEQKDWIVIKIIPQDNILSALYADLYYNRSLYPSRRKKAEISLSISASNLSIGSSIKTTDNAPAPNLVESIRNILLTAGKKKKKILVCIDEISCTPEMAAFSSAIQLYIGDGLPIYFLGTGIYENIEALKNISNLTFLYRAPTIELNPLDFGRVTDSYRRTFHISLDEAMKLAKITKGYSFAYQSLGYVYWNHQPVKDLNILMPEFDQILAEGSYHKIWQELSNKDKETAAAIAANEGKRTIDIRTAAGIDSNTFSTYQNRLKQRGLLESRSYGYVSFSLPRFSEFIKAREAGY